MRFGRSMLVAAVIATVSLVWVTPSASAAPPAYRVKQTVTLPSAGSGIAVDETQGRVYVAARFASQVFVYDEATMTLLQTISVPNQPYQVAVDQTTGYVYVSQYTGNNVTGSVAVIDPTTLAVVATVPVGQSPVGVTVSTSSRRVYVANYSSTFVTVLDITAPAAPVALAPIPIPSAAETVTENASGSILYAARSSSNAVSVVDVATGAVVANWTGGLSSVHQVVLSNGEVSAFVSAQLATTASIFNLATNTLSGTIPLANSYFQSVDRSSDSLFMTAPFTNGGTLAVLDAATGAITQQLTVPSAMYVATDSTRHLTFTTTNSTTALTVIELVPTVPAVTQSPADRSLEAGSDAAFTASANSSVAMTMRWQTSTDGGATWPDVVGATTGTLTLPAVTLAQTGLQVRVLFTNSVGTTTSAVATLTVTAPTPVVTKQPTDETVMVGGDATFAAMASSMTPATVRWQASSDGGATWTDVPGATTVTLVLPSLALTDSGTRVRALFTNSTGSTSTASASVIVTPIGSVDVAPPESGASVPPAGDQLAGSEDHPGAGALAGDPTPAPESELALTGTQSAVLFAVIGLGCVLLGVAQVAASRRSSPVDGRRPSERPAK